MMSSLHSKVSKKEGGGEESRARGADTPGVGMLCVCVFWKVVGVSMFTKMGALANAAGTS